jgi:hypothetical protein
MELDLIIWLVEVFIGIIYYILYIAPDVSETNRYF